MTRAENRDQIGKVLPLRCLKDLRFTATFLNKLLIANGAIVNAVVICLAIVGAVVQMAP